MNIVGLHGRAEGDITQLHKSVRGVELMQLVVEATLGESISFHRRDELSGADTSDGIVGANPMYLLSGKASIRIDIHSNTPVVVAGGWNEVDDLNLNDLQDDIHNALEIADLMRRVEEMDYTTEFTFVPGPEAYAIGTITIKMTPVEITFHADSRVVLKVDRVHGPKNERLNVLDSAQAQLRTWGIVTEPWRVNREEST